MAENERVLADAIAELGFNGSGAAESTTQIAGRFGVKLVLRDVRIDFEYSIDGRSGRPRAAAGVASFGAELRVQDTRNQREIYRRECRGRGKDRGSNPQPIRIALADLARQYTQDPAFAIAVSGK